MPVWDQPLNRWHPADCRFVRGSFIRQFPASENVAYRPALAVSPQFLASVQSRAACPVAHS